MGGRGEQGDSEDSTGVGAMGGVLWETGTGRGRTMLSSVEISSSRKETQETGLGSSADNSSSSFWISSVSFLLPTGSSVSFVFLGMFDALWIMCTSAGEMLDSAFFSSDSHFCSDSVLIGFALPILLRAFAFASSSAAFMKASSSAAFMKASSPSSLDSSFTVIGDVLLDLLPSFIFFFLLDFASERLADLL